LSTEVRDGAAAPAEGPAPPRRLDIVDILRGLALLGMLAAHFQYYPPHHFGARLGESPIVFVKDYFVDGRFYPLFALLFGIGFALQFERHGDRPGLFKMYVRRLLALAGFGIALNALTGFSVLELYAFWGFILLFVRRWSNRALAILAILLIFTQPMLMTAKFLRENRGLSAAESNARYKRVAVEEAEARKASRPIRQREDEIKRHGPFLAAMGLRIKNTFQLYKNPLIPALNVLPIFIFGILVVRRKVLEKPEAHRHLLWIVFGLAVLLALASLFLSDLMPKPPDLQTDPRGFRLFYARLAFAFAPLYIGESFWQGLCYAIAMVLFASRFPRFRSFVSPLAYAGRMSLTNYIGQVAFLELMFGWLWLNIPVTRPWALAGTFALFAAQLLISRWWMDRFRTGPFEWLWRSLSYARWESIRRLGEAGVSMRRLP
jgi:uncharacterized protein